MAILVAHLPERHLQPVTASDYALSPLDLAIVGNAKHLAGG
jgi:hypothetical protein